MLYSFEINFVAAEIQHNRCQNIVMKLFFKVQSIETKDEKNLQYNVICKRKRNKLSECST